MKTSDRVHPHPALQPWAGLSRLERGLRMWRSGRADEDHLATRTQGMISALIDLLSPAARPEAVVFQPTGESWTHLRQPPTDDDRTLSDEAKLWLKHLPAFAWPKVLCCRYPRLANRLAQVWVTPAACDALLDSLLIDLRGGRTGFAPSIRAELVRLERYYQTAKPALQRWQEALHETDGP